MKSRDTMVQLVRFKTEEKRKKVADLETMIRDFDGMAVDLDRQIEAEHERTGVRDEKHFSYSTFAKAASQRRSNLRASVDDLKQRLDAAREELNAAQMDLKRAEQIEDRDTSAGRRRSESNGFGVHQAARQTDRA
jgi:flagellar protein FliJ